MREIQQALTELLADPVTVLKTQSVSGGCISDAKRVQLRDSRGNTIDYFLKSNSPEFLDNFACEWDGLSRLAATGTIRVPNPIAMGIHGARAWLVLQWVDQGRMPSDYFEKFARGLADLHRTTAGHRIGLDRDNFLGAARQINSAVGNTMPANSAGGDRASGDGPSGDWPAFFAQQRIDFQLRWATDQGLADAGLKRDVGQIVRDMSRLLAGSETRTCLLHGDLWSGNYLCDQRGEPVLIDPAVYYGNREAEFGMLRLFGSCPPRFYAAYQEAFPLVEGWQRRVNVYVLYHLLNHLNLFGQGYHGQCRQLAEQILKP